MTDRTPLQAHADRTAYLELNRILMQLRQESRGMHAVVPNIVDCPNMLEYAARRSAILRAGYEQMGIALAELAAEAKEKADTYFTLLTDEAVS